MAQQGQPGTAGVGTDPAYVPDREVFGAYTHQQIWDLAHEHLAPADLSRLADTWGHTATAVETAFDEFARDLTRLSGDWSGLAAVAAAQAAAAFVRAGDHAVAVCRVVELLLSADSAAAEAVRTAIPPPPAPYLPDPDPAAEAATGARRRTAYNTTAAALTAQAQDAMAFGYNPTIPASGDAVPRFAPPAAGAPDDKPPLARAPARSDTPATPPQSRPGGTPSDPAAPPPPAAGAGAAPNGPARGSDPGGPGPGSGAPVAVRGGASDDSPAVAAPQPTGGHARPGSSPGAPAPAPDTAAYAPDAPTSPADTGVPSSDTATPPSGTATSPSSTATPPSSTATPPAGTATPPSSTAMPAARTASGPSSPTESGIAGSAGTATTATTPAVRTTAPAADLGGITGPPRAPIPAPQPIGGPDRSEPSPAPAAIPPRPPAPTGWSPAETAGRTDTAAPVGGHRPGPVDSSAPHTRQSFPTDSGAGAAQRPGQFEPIARSVSSRPITEAARESSGPTGAGADPAVTERSEHPWTRTVRPGGFPLPAAPGPVPWRAPDRERSSPDYLHAPNEELTAVPPTVPPVFGEYTGTEEPDRTRPGDGNR
ncbi:hypothetical protein ABZV91_02470 [Nocardia sp. NPDC004568]|uniref:hypothetical protein n=1 Tax=Nocardia sp. NPDC004568 TaxID=3154551 RepID=UPI0033A92F83